jgi:hypothetical protein
MAYGCDVPTEAAYRYKKVERIQSNDTSNDFKFDDIPAMSHVIWEEYVHTTCLLPSRVS